MKIGKKVIISLILLLFFLLIISVVYYYNEQQTYMLTPLPLFVPTTFPPDVSIPQGEYKTIVVGFSYNDVVREPDVVFFYLSSTIGEVPPFVHATFDPDVITVRPGERFYSNLTLKIDSNATIGKYYLSASVKSSRFGGHDRYDGVWVCGECGSCFYLNVITAS
ncbi:MAG: hypothetical protein QMD22_05130 [archaeon]|nr:hypothetical protein [archaeon]